jgi:hypothetical protein
MGGDKEQTTTTDTTNVDSRQIITNTLDGGAIKGALDVATGAVSGMAGLAGQVVKSQASAYDYADNIFSGALDHVNKNDGRMLDAFERAATMQKDALTQVRGLADNTAHIQGDAFSSSLGFVKDAYTAASKAQTNATDQIQNAYADSKGTTQSQQKIMLAVLAVAGVAVASSIAARG